MSTYKRLGGKLLAIMTMTIGIVMAFALLGCSTPDPKTQDPTVAPGLPIDISAKDWDDETSTPCIIELEPVSQSDEGPTIYSFEVCNDTVVIDCEAGDYTLRVIPPINADGSTYAMPAERTVSSSDFGEIEDALMIDLELLSPDEATAEDIANVLAAFEAALEKVDVQDMEKTDALALAKKNAEANPNYAS